MKVCRRLKNSVFIPAIVLMSLLATAAMADGTAIDRVYDPYVEPREREVELRGIVPKDDDDKLNGLQLSKLGLRWSWSDWVSTEFYVIGESTNDQSLKVEAYEIEGKWQLTEQGEFWADWGVLFELEKERDLDAWRYITRMVVLKEYDRWVTTANLLLIYDWGDDIATGWETAFSMQGRYRLTRAFEPALEFYSGKTNKGLGPVFMGDIRTGQMSKLHWEIGVIFGLDNESADETYRWLLEYEF